MDNEKTTRADAGETLEKAILRHEQKRILELFHQVDIVPEYDYKDQRKRT